jgi:hypothetical protein
MRTCYNKGVDMNVKETLDKAYGSVPNEITPYFNMDWVPTRRGVKYYWLMLVRKFTR